MTDQVPHNLKVSDQDAEGKRGHRTATKASAENFTPEQQAQPTEKFTTYSGEEPNKVLLAAMPGETLEAFTARTKQYHQEQEQKAKNKPAIEPLCIGGFEDGSVVTASTGIMRPLTPGTEMKIRVPKDAKHEQISQSTTMMAIEAQTNPAMDVVAKCKQHADKMQEGEEKQRLLALSRQQAAELSPEMHAYYEQKPPTNTQEGWLAVAQKIAQLPLEKQFQVIGSGLLAGIEQYRNDERERTWGQLIGTVQGTGEALQGLAKIADFGAACIVGDDEQAGKMGDEFGAAIGQTIVGGVRLFQAAEQYLYNIGYTSDYAKPFRDVAAAGEKLDEQWGCLPSREQERVKTKLITELLAGGAIGAGGAGAIQKASKFTEILDAVAIETKALYAAAKPGIKKAVKAVNNAVDELIQPIGDTGMGVRMPFPKDPLKDETKMLMSKADDMGDHNKPKHPEKDLKGESVEKYTPPKWFAAELTRILERLSPGERSFIAEHGIKIMPLRRMADKFPLRRDLASCYDASENTIYVPEQVPKLGRFVPNNDLEFAFRHEFGHAYNAKLDPFGEYISNLQKFKDVFAEDLKRVPQDVLEELRLSRTNKVPEVARDEVFADMYAHAFGLQSNNAYSQKLKQWFPNCLKYLKEMPKP